MAGLQFAARIQSLRFFLLIVRPNRSVTPQLGADARHKFKWETIDLLNYSLMWLQTVGIFYVLSGWQEINFVFCEK